MYVSGQDGGVQGGVDGVGRLVFGSGDSAKSRGGVDAVLDAVPALGEEEVAAHLAGQLGLGLAHLRLDHLMPGLPHQRAAAVSQDVAGQASGALDVAQYHRSRVTFEPVCGQQLQRSEETRGGYECARTCRSQWSPDHTQVTSLILL